MNWPQGTLGALNTALSCVAWIIPLGVRQAFGCETESCCSEIVGTEQLRGCVR